MARTSPAKGGAAARARQPKAAVRRAAGPDKVVPTAVDADGRPSSPLPEPEPAGAATAGRWVAPPEDPGSQPSAAEASAGGGLAAPPPEPFVVEPEVEPEAAGDQTARPDPVAAAEPAPAPDLTAVLGASRTLVEGTLRARSQMIGFSCRQAQHGLAVSRAMLASASLPEALALQAKYLGQAFDEALVQSLELSRLSTDLVRAGLQSLRPRQAVRRPDL